MGLSSTTIQTWGDIKTMFLLKYQDYFQTIDLREDIFRMKHKEEENLEDYVE